MHSLTLLSGKVLKRPIPIVDRSSPSKPPVKRLLLPHGELAQIYDGDSAIRYIAYIELKEGCVRGNHYHQQKEEHIYVMQGEVLLVVEDFKSGARETISLQAGDLAVIQPGVAHALRPIVAGHAIEFAPVRFDPSDIYAFQLIK